MLLYRCLNSLPKQALLPSVTTLIDRCSNLRFSIVVSIDAGLIGVFKTESVHVQYIWYDGGLLARRCHTLSKTDYNHTVPSCRAFASTMVNLPTHTTRLPLNSTNYL